MFHLISLTQRPNDGIRNQPKINTRESMMKRTALCVVALCLVNVVAAAQTPNTVVAGPNGVPRLVKDEGGTWSVPTKVYEDAKQVVYVPDITTPGWAQWHEQTFNDQGIYFTFVYTYLRKQQATVQETLYVNVLTHRAIAVPFLKPPVKIDLLHTSPSIAKATAAITKLAQESLAHYHGPSLKDAVRGQRALALHNLDVMKQNEQDQQPYAQQPPAPIVRQKPAAK